jgi:hypothetical protein
MKKWLFAILFIFLFCLSSACQKPGQETAKAAEANRDTDVAAIKPTHSHSTLEKEA